MQATRSKTLLTESFPQRFLVISKALPPFYVERLQMPLACINTQQTTAKTISKVQQTLSVFLKQYFSLIAKKTMPPY